MRWGAGDDGGATLLARVADVLPHDHHVACQIIHVQKQLAPTGALATALGSLRPKACKSEAQAQQTAGLFFG